MARRLCSRSRRSGPQTRHPVVPTTVGSANPTYRLIDDRFRTQFASSISESSPPASFVAPVGIAVSVVSLLLVAWLLTNSTAVQARDTGIAAAIGLVIYFASSRKATDGRASDPA